MVMMISMSLMRISHHPKPRDNTKRNCKLIGLSVDPVTRHGEWAADIEETQGYKVNYPMIGDPELKVAKLVLPESDF